MRDNAGEAGGNSKVTFSYEHLQCWPTYLQQLRWDSECSMEDLPGSMDNRDEWRDRAREIHASNANSG